MLIAVFVFAAVAQSNTDQAQWAREVTQLWDVARRVPIDDSVDSRVRYGPKVLAHERGLYKVEFPGGRKLCTDNPPRGTAGVHAVWKRTPGAPVAKKVAGSDDLPIEYWVRASWIAEKSRWETGSARALRASTDDRNYRAWMTKVGYGRHMRGSGIRTWALSAGYLIKDRGALRTALDRLARKDDEQTRAQVKEAEAVYSQRLAQLKRGLMAAGSTLGVGDAMWRCQKATLDLAEASSAEKTAKAEVAKLRLLVANKPQLADQLKQAQKAWERHGQRANECRRDRRKAMEAVMRGVF